MASITISREMGSQGCQVAQVVAQRLGFQLVWRELINQAAIRAGVREVALAEIDELGLLGLHPDPQAVQAYLAAIDQIMHELADSGQVVIVGRAGQAILREREDVLHVRVMAPVETRIARLAEGKGISPAAAQAQIEASDHLRSQFLRRNYHIRWDDPALYDLVVNTAHLSPNEAGGLIFQAFEYRYSAEIHPHHSTPTEIDCD